MRNVNKINISEITNGLNSELKRIPNFNVNDKKGIELHQLFTNAQNYYLNDCEEYIIDNRDIKGMLGIDTQDMSLVQLFSNGDHFQKLTNDLGSKKEIRNQPSYTVDYIVGKLNKPDRAPICIVSLANALGEIEQEFCKAQLSLLSNHLNKSDRLIFGVDLRKSPTVIDLAYSDEDGHCSHYTKHIFTLLNEEFGANFNLDRFIYDASYNPETGILSKYLISTAAQKVTLNDQTSPIILSKWETIKIGLSKKYSHQEVNQLLISSGLSTLDYVTDDKGWYALYVVEKSPW